MPQIKITITDEELELLKREASRNLNSLSKEARHMIYNGLMLSQEEKDQIELIKHLNQVKDYINNLYDLVHGVPTPAPTPDQPPFELFREKKRRNYIPDPPADFTPPAVQQPPQPEIIKTTGYKPEITSITNIKSEQNQTLPGTGQTPQSKPVIRPQSELEQEDVDSKWDAEGNEYSREDFIQELTEFERRMREDCPSYEDPTQDPDYVKLKNYFIKNDFRQRFRDLLSDPTRFYSEPGVYDNPSLRFAQNAFKKEKIDEDYIVSLLLGTGASYRAKNQSRLYVDDQY